MSLNRHTHYHHKHHFDFRCRNPASPSLLQIINKTDASSIDYKTYERTGPK